jgi:CBS domain-containing protein
MKTKTPSPDVLIYPDPATVKVNTILQDLVIEYAESTAALLDELEKLALAYEQGSDPQANEANIKCVLHKIKGESGVMGVEIISEVFHKAEDLFDKLKKADRTDMLLRTRDWAYKVISLLNGKQLSALDDAMESALERQNKGPNLITKPITTAQEVMKTSVISITEDTPVYEAIGLLVSKNITALPVINKDLTLAGILSEKDVLRLLYDFEDKSHNVANLMTRQVTTFAPETDIEQICSCFMQNDFRRVVILENNKLLGMVSRRNIIAAHKAAYDKIHTETVRKKSKIFRARDIMTTGILTVEKDTSVIEVIENIVESNVTGLPVVNKDMSLAGVITEKDVLKLSCDMENLKGKVAEYMTENVKHFGPDDSLIDICDCLIQNPFRRVPILDSRKRIIGLVSRRDMISFILQRRASVMRRRKTD